MKRSTGVTVSAILVFIGSGLTLIFGAFTVVALFFLPQQPSQPPFFRYILLFVVAMYLAFGIWGIASGVGLLRVRQWARISMLVFSGMLLVFTLPVLLIVPFMPMPQPEGVPNNFVLMVKIGMSIFYGIIAAIGGGWLYFFNRRTVKDQFRSPEESLSYITHPSRRPISISVIGWLLIIGPCFLVPMLLLRLPILFLGQLLDGWRAGLFALALCATQLAAGVGLLRLRPWARVLAIGTFLFGILNCLTMALPGTATRFEHVNAVVQARMGSPMAASPEMAHFSMWAGAIFGVVGIAIQLWFVVTRKPAFFATPETSAPLP